jgi:hypothetical protein
MASNQTSIIEGVKYSLYNLHSPNTPGFDAGATVNSNGLLTVMYRNDEGAAHRYRSFGYDAQRGIQGNPTSPEDFLKDVQQVLKNPHLAANSGVPQATIDKLRQQAATHNTADVDGVTYTMGRAHLGPDQRGYDMQGRIEKRDDSDPHLVMRYKDEATGKISSYGISPDGKITGDPKNTKVLLSDAARMLQEPNLARNSGVDESVARQMQDTVQQLQAQQPSPARRITAEIRPTPHN